MKEKVIGGNPINIDESLILERAIYQRDRKAVTVLHAKYYVPMKHYIASCINSLADAEDLAQNVFVELCKGNGRYDGHGSVERYLFGIARNAIRKYHHERAHSVKTIPIDSVYPIDTGKVQQSRGPARQIEAQELKKAIEEAVAKLPSKARQAIKLRFIDGLSNKQAAQKAGCTHGTFRFRLSYAIETLRKTTGSKLPWNT